MTRKAWPEVAEASQHGLRALHELARRQLLRENKEMPIRDAAGIAARGAYALLRCGADRDAVVALKAGYALMLSEVLERDRADLKELGQRYPGVLTRYKNAAHGVDELERRQHANPELNRTGGLRAARAKLDQAVARSGRFPATTNSFGFRRSTRSKRSLACSLWCASRRPKTVD